jgi:hypothetical protein
MEDILASIDSERNQNSQEAFISGGKDKPKLAQQVIRDKAKSMAKVMAYRQEGQVSEGAYDGYQWDALDRMRLEQLKRPTITFNQIKPTVNAVSGIERLNRADIRFVSRPLDSDPVQDEMGDLASEAYATVLDLCDGDSERSRAIKDMSITGMGWYEIRMDYEIDPDGRIMLERVPWKEMVWDTNAKKENIIDTKFRMRIRKMPLDEFRTRWPKKAEILGSDAPDYPENDVSKYELVTPYYSLANEKNNPLVSDEGGKALATSIEVIQYQWAEPTAVYRYADPQAQGGIRELREADYNKLKIRLTMLGLPEPSEVIRQKRTVFKEVYVAKGIQLDEPEELPGGFSLKCITGEWDDEKKVWYGMVRPLLDPQRTMNKSMSTALSMFLTNAKGGVMYETGAFADPEMAKNQWSRADAWIELNEGKAEAVVQRQPINHQGAVDLFFNESKNAMTYVSGIPQEMLGVAIGDATAPVMSKRVQAALSVLGWYFDNVTRARRDEARTVLEYIREYWSQGQLIRVGGKANSKAIPLLKSALPISYDLMLDESVRHNPNLKAQVWQDIQPMIPALIKFGLGRFLLQILEYSPLPAQLVQQLQQEAAQNPPQMPGKDGNRGPSAQPPENPQETQARIMKLVADAQKSLAQAEQIKEQSGLQVAEMMFDLQHKREELRQKDDLQKHRQVSDLIKATRLETGGDGQMNPGDPGMQQNQTGY